VQDTVLLDRWAWPQLKREAEGDLGTVLDALPAELQEALTEELARATAWRPALTRLAAGQAVQVLQILQAAGVPLERDAVRGALLGEGLTRELLDLGAGCLPVLCPALGILGVFPEPEVDPAEEEEADVELEQDARRRATRVIRAARAPVEVPAEELPDLVTEGELVLRISPAAGVPADLPWPPAPGTPAHDLERAVWRETDESWTDDEDWSDLEDEDLSDVFLDTVVFREGRELRAVLHWASPERRHRRLRQLALIFPGATIQAYAVRSSG
jgi:hypothetical protein